jgi:hypothetical protein
VKKETRQERREKYGGFSKLRLNHFWALLAGIIALVGLVVVLLSLPDSVTSLLKWMQAVGVLRSQE